MVHREELTELALDFYRVYHRFRQAKFYNGDLILSLSQFLLLHQLPLKMKLAIKWSKSILNNMLANNNLNP
jgi:hypothetical protein